MAKSSAIVVVENSNLVGHCLYVENLEENLMESESEDDQRSYYVKFEASLVESTSFLGFGICYPKGSGLS